ncbi:MAG: branched-chain amino acid aminotransferase [Hyphomicrobiales bacterium]|nr:branched-chain amino acid aminotransferase [Hyphomicrobiales bacterium]MCP5372332.1 branched-chain amino acid aminotransferase [Hyphomicrobiales bacterium]
MGKVVTGNGISFVDGDWHEGNPMILGPRTHAMWMASVVFDGARYFDGVAPDLDRHMARCVRSAELLGLKPTLAADEMEHLARAGIARFPADAQLYINPIYYADDGFVMPDPDTTRFVLSIFEAPLPAPDGFSACKSSFRRPARDMAPTEAKASCLYPNVGRVAKEAGDKGFTTAVVMDPSGNVAEFAYTNLFMAKDGQVHTPAINGTFLNGITRQRVIALLRDAGVDVVERAIAFDDLMDADEVFATGNFAKVQPCTRLEHRDLQEGPMYRRARELYMDFARDCALDRG